jgi:hypothetical protein
VQWIDLSFGRPAMINNWSLEVQHEFSSDLILKVAYLGQRSTHLRPNFNDTNCIRTSDIDSPKPK